ncbi:hypothetical protein [Streptomyces sp. NPDC004675]|uniref:hypothetical protein n=1 Tax=Streptomyces sp. NPDC004675 TaxID=3154286 RepID=UPI0033A4CE88
MTKFLLAVHVLAAIVAVGPATVAASMFPPLARKVQADSGESRLNLALLHRICRMYAVVGVAVPVFGFATAKNMGVLGDTWLIVSIALTVVAAVVLGALVLPRQGAVLRSVEEGVLDARATVRLAMVTGIFNLLWAAVTVLMIVRPGSTTGA